MEVLKQVKINILLLDMIKQVPAYAKFLKDLCTMKRRIKFSKKGFLTKQVSTIIENKVVVKYKDPRCPTISVQMGDTYVEKALLNLGANVNLLPYCIYKQLGLGRLKAIAMTLFLADWSIKVPRGIVEYVSVWVDKFYNLADFMVLDKSLYKGVTLVPVILRRPFLATTNALINFQNGVMKLFFGNMTLELNVFNLSPQQINHEEKESEKVCQIKTLIQRPTNKILKNMEPMVDSTWSIKRVQEGKLLKIPKEYKKHRMNKKINLGVLEEELYERWWRTRDKLKFYHGKRNKKRKFNLSKRQVPIFSPITLLNPKIGHMFKVKDHYL